MPSPQSILQQLVALPIQNGLEMMDQKNRNCLVMGAMTCIVGSIDNHTVGVMYDRDHCKPPTWFILYGGAVTKTVSKVDDGFQMKLACEKSVRLLHTEDSKSRTMFLKDQTITIVVTPEIISW